MIIEYYIKPVDANTVYIDIDTQDKSYILHWLTVFLADMCELMTTNTDYIRQLLSKNKNLPKNKNGRNSILGFAGGIVSQHQNNSKKNFTQAQISGIEYLFDIIGNYYDTAETVTFRKI